MTYFAVITKVPDDFDGNYSTSEAYINPNGKEHVAGSNIVVAPYKFSGELFGRAILAIENKTIDLNVEQYVFVSIPVFKLGEILVMGPNDRTIPDGRKPSKWNVSYETFDDIEDAIKKANAVLGESK
jgi:hypothetical protein